MREFYFSLFPLPFSLTFVGVGAGALLLLIVLWDTFETIVLPRTVTRRIRLTRFFFSVFWKVWTVIATRLDNSRRESLIAAFGPLSLLMLLVAWGLCLIFGFTLIQWGLGWHLHPGTQYDFRAYFYTSCLTFFTMGFGDISPTTTETRIVAVAEAGVGFGFLALVIGYLPVLYQSFSRREVGISLLDARAGSPPSGVELLRRHGANNQIPALTALLAEWERWSADVLESHLSYPVLAFYRSQHDRESWLAALTAILDACSLILMGFETDAPWQADLLWQAQLTFAMGRHAVIDLALITKLDPLPPVPDRLPPELFAALGRRLNEADVPICRNEAAVAKLTTLRRQYEPYVNALAGRLLLSLPPWMSEESVPDNWQTSAWEDDHFHA
jgi:hypothetical protein